MKNVYARLASFLVIFLMASSFATASHISGGDFNITCLGNGQYLINLNLYRDCSGITMPTTADLNINSSCGNADITANLLNAGGTEISQLCPSVLDSSTCHPPNGTLPGMELYIYQATVTLPPCSDWVIEWNTCCRNNTVNVPTSNGDGTSLVATLDNAIAPCNNSPVFTAQPIPYVCINQPVTYNYGTYEPDGDSLYFVLVPGLDPVFPAPASNPLVYAAPYSATNPIDGLTLDSLTGEISFTPTTLGNFIVAVQAQEFDANGNLIGTITRDIQFVVENCVNQVPGPDQGDILNLSGSATQIDSITVEMCDGGNFIFNISIDDPDTLDTVTLSSNIADALPGAIFTQVSGNPATATIEWTAPGANNFFNSFTVFAEDDACPVPGIQAYVYKVQMLESTVASEDVLVTCGDQVGNMFVTGGNSFTWSILYGDSIELDSNFFCLDDDTICSVVLGDPDTTTAYLVTSDLTSTTCQTQDTVIVFVVPDYSFLHTQDDTAICLFEDVQFTVTPTPAGAYTYNWESGPGYIIDDSTSATPTISYTSPGVIAVPYTITSPELCVKFDTTYVTVSAAAYPVFEITGDTTVCIGDSTQLGVNFVPLGSGQCDYSLEMFDSFGDGWGGGEIETIINGTPSGNTFSGIGAANTAAVTLTHGDEVSLFYTSGFAEGENTYNFLDPDGNVLFSDGPTPSVGNVFTFTADCIPGNPDDYSYTWTPSAGLNYDTIIDPMVNPVMDTSTYQVVVLNAVGGCSDSSLVTIYNVPSFGWTTTQSDTSVCLFEGLAVSVTPDSAGTYSYQWDTVNTINNDTIFNPLYTMIVSGVNQLYFEIENEFGCQKYDSITVDVSSGAIPAASILADTTICLGDSAQLLAINTNTSPGFSDNFNGGLQASWDQLQSAGSGTGCGGAQGSTDALVFNGATNPRFAITPPMNLSLGIGTISFWIISGSGGGCETPDFAEELTLQYSTDGGTTWIDIQIFATGGQYATWTFVSFPIPSGAATNATQFQWIQNTSSGNNFDNWAIDDLVIDLPSSDYTYDWFPTAGLSDSTISNPYFNQTTNSVYSVIITDTVGNCADTATVNLSVVPNFTWNLNQTDTVVCLFQEVTATVTPNPAGTYEYMWEDSISYELDYDTAATVVVTYNEPGLSGVPFSMTNDVGCTRFDTLRVTVSGAAYPLVEIIGDTTVCNGDSTDLEVTFISTDTVGCDYTLDMQDTFGDGWNGAQLEVFADGTSLGVFTATGTGTVATFTASAGDNITLVYSPGNFENEVSYDLIDPDGNILFSDGPFPATGTVYTFLAPCGAGVPSDYVYSWSSTSIISDTSVYDPTVTPTQAVSNFQVIVSDPLGVCADTSDIDVYIVPNFTWAVVQSDTGICLNDTVNFQINPDPVGAYTFSWDDPDGALGNDTIDDNTTGTFNNAGVRWVYYTMTTAAGCTNNDSAFVDVSPGLEPNPVISADSVICIGDSTQLVVDFITPNLSCDFTFDLTDAGGNGWSGATLDITVNGFLFTSASVPNGSSSTSITLGFNQGDVVELTYNNSFNNSDAENAFTYTGPFGNVIFSSASPPQPGVNFTGNAACFSGVNYVYDWTVGDFLSDSTIRNPWSTPTGDISYTVLVEDTLGGCSGSATIDLTIVPDFDPTVTQTDTAVCLLESVVFNVNDNAPGNSDVTWTTSHPQLPILNFDNIANPTGAFVQPGMFDFFIETVNSGCTRYDTVSVTVSPGTIPNIDVTADSTSFCVGGSTQLFVTNTEPPAGCEYTLEMYDTFGDGWNSGALEIEVDGSVIDTYTLMTGTQQVETFTLFHGNQVCINFTSGNTPGEESYTLFDSFGNLLFTDGPLPANGNGVFCFTADCGIDPVNYAYTWVQDVATLSAVNIVDPIATPTQQTTYVITVVDLVGGCSDVDSIVVDVNLPPDAGIDPAGPFCENAGTVTLTANTPGGTWSGTGVNGTGTFDPGAANSGINTITYLVGPAGCTSDSTMQIVVNENPAAPNPQANPFYCVGDTLIGVNVTGAVGSTFTWFDAAGNPLSTDQQPDPNVLPVADLGVTLDVLQTSAEGCESGISTLAINAVEIPVATILCDVDSGLAPLVVNFTNGSTPSNSPVQWDFGDPASLANNTSVDQNPSHTFDNFADYLVQLIVESDVYGECKDTTLKVITVSGQASFEAIPNVFTPNSDGMNDVFRLEHINVVDYCVSIYDRWGRKVGEITDEAPEWNGEKHKDGTYFWVIDFATGVDGSGLTDLLENVDPAKPALKAGSGAVHILDSGN